MNLLTILAFEDELEKISSSDECICPSARCMGCPVHGTEARLAKGMPKYTEGEMKRHREDRHKRYLKEKKACFLPGGLASKAHKTPADFDPKQLAKGAKVEKREHGVPMAAALSISADHLTENPNTYKKSS
jgi:hypothetical protein